MTGMKWRAGRLHLAVALTVVAAIALVFASVAIADESGPSEYPPPPPSPIAPPDWDFEEGGFMPYVGDVNFSGGVTPADASDILVDAMTPPGGEGSLSATALAVADTYGRGYSSPADASHILLYAMDPTGGLGVLDEPMWDWENDEYHSLRDPFGQNAG